MVENQKKSDNTMNTQDLGKLCAEVDKVAREAGKFILSQQKKLLTSQVEVKGLNDFVTYVDKQSEELIIRQLERLLPNSDFLAEENTRTRAGEDYTWIIDPLDGTTNFIHGLPCFCVSIGLINKAGDLVIGVVLEINQDECFSSWKDGGAFLNGQRIFVSQRNKLKDSLLVTGFPYTDFSKMDEYLQLFRYMMEHSHGLRRLGSAAADLAYVAAGRCEAFYEYSLKPWDVAAGALLVKEAGGVVSDFSGGNKFIFNQEIIASNAGIFQELLEKIGEFGLADI
jgi:myo-inositol-1(or 4)-monophosphatase